MTGREKIHAALSPEGTPEIPVVICYHGIFLRDHWDQVTDQPWWALSDSDPDRHIAVHRDMISKLGEDWFQLPTGPSHWARERTAVETRSDGVYSVDRETGTAQKLKRPRVGGWPEERRVMSAHPAHPPMSREEIDEQLPLGPEPDYQAPFRNGSADVTKQLLDEFGSEKYPIQSVGSPLWRCYSLWGFEGMMTALMDMPDLVEYVCQREAEIACRSVKQSAALGAVGIWLEECMTDMVSPDAFRRFNLPYLRRIVDTIREAGMHSVYYYCGDPAGKLDLLLESGADALGLEESKKGFDIDIADIAEHVDGRMALLGNLDAIHLLETGTEEEIRAEIARQIAAGRRNGSRFVMSIGSPVTPGTPTERVRQYCEWTREMGRA